MSPRAPLVLLLPLLFAGHPSGAQGQEPPTEGDVILGRVLDATTDQPIVGANVATGGGNHLTSTDEKGRFELSADLLDETGLRIQELGYRDLVLGRSGLHPGVPMTFRLEPAPIALEGIEVAVDRLERRREAFSGRVRSLSVEGMEEVATPTAYEAVASRLLPTLAECRGDRDRFRWVRSCLARGGRPTVFIDESVIVHDGMEVLATIPRDDIYSIAVYRGGSIMTGVQIRVYTKRFMERLAEHPGLLAPRIF